MLIQKMPIIASAQGAASHQYRSTKSNEHHDIHVLLSNERSIVLCFDYYPYGQMGSPGLAFGPIAVRAC
jgi:hypothetical protein